MTTRARQHPPLPAVAHAARRAARMAAWAALALGWAAGAGAQQAAPQAAPEDAQQATPTTTIFGRVETIVLPNGVKVWYAPAPDETVVYMSAMVPFGRDDDPRGEEPVAHLLEHVQFGPRDGLTEDQLNRQIDDVGGSVTAATYDDHTAYRVRVPAAYAGRGLRWLGRVVSPLPIDADAVDRQREPVRLETGARPRQPLDVVRAAFVDPPWLRPASVWRRDFGIDAAEDRGYDAYAGISRLSAADLRAFYERHYAPAGMTVIVAGPMPRDTLLAALAATFGALRERPAAPLSAAPPRATARRTHDWKIRASATYEVEVPAYGRAAADDAMLLVVQTLLAKRLDDQLRMGAEKSVYHPDVQVRYRGPGALLHVGVETTRRDLPRVRAVVDRELGALRDASVPWPGFEQDRDALALKLRANAAHAERLDGMAVSVFYRTAPGERLPDFLTMMDTVSRASLAAFARRQLPLERQSVAIHHPLPYGYALPAAVALAALALGAVIARRLFVSPLDTTRLRYVAKFKPPLALLAAGALAFAVAVAVPLRLLAGAGRLLFASYLARVDSLAVQWAAVALLLVAAVLLVYAALARVPRKLLVLDDGVVVKYAAYRSARLRPDDVAELTLRRFGEVYGSRRLTRVLPLALGLRRPAIYLRPHRGRALFFSTRDDAETMRVLQALVTLEAADVRRQASGGTR